MTLAVCGHKPDPEPDPAKAFANTPAKTPRQRGYLDHPKSMAISQTPATDEDIWKVKF